MRWLELLIDKTGYDMDYIDDTLIIKGPVIVYDFVRIKKILKKMNKNVGIKVE